MGRADKSSGAPMYHGLDLGRFQDMGIVASRMPLNHLVCGHRYAGCGRPVASYIVSSCVASHSTINITPSKQTQREATGARERCEV